MTDSLRESDHIKTDSEDPIEPHKIHTKAETVVKPSQKEVLWYLDEATCSVCEMHDGGSLYQHSERLLEVRNGSE